MLFRRQAAAHEGKTFRPAFHRAERKPDHTPEILENNHAVRRIGGSRPCHPAHVASQLRHSVDRERRGLEISSNDARSQRHQHDPDIHTHHKRTLEVRLQTVPPSIPMNIIKSSCHSAFMFRIALQSADGSTFTLLMRSRYMTIVAGYHKYICGRSSASIF